MSNTGGNASRFTSQNKTTQERLSTQTVGLVHLSEFRKRRAEVLEQQEREARDTLLTTNSTPNRSLSRTPIPESSANDSASGADQPPSKKPRKKVKKKAGPKLSFGSDEDEDTPADKEEEAEKSIGKSKDEDGKDPTTKKPSFQANASVGIVPKALTKAAVRQEAAAREALRREFLQIQEAVKSTEIAIPFVFYDGTSIPGGTVRVKKGEHVWVFLDKSRKVGAELQVGADRLTARKQWARVGVDDLILVRGSIIIPHHYDFYFFAINKSIGPDGARIFDYTAEATPQQRQDALGGGAQDKDQKKPVGGLTTAAELKTDLVRRLPDISTLEGADDDPAITKVVDRRWYERNKHIYPASLWQEFDPEKDYVNEIRRDLGGNAFFYAK